MVAFINRVNVSGVLTPKIQNKDLTSETFINI